MVTATAELALYEIGCLELTEGNCMISAQFLKTPFYSVSGSILVLTGSLYC